MLARFNILRPAVLMLAAMSALPAALADTLTPAEHRIRVTKQLVEKHSQNPDGYNG